MSGERVDEALLPDPAVSIDDEEEEPGIIWII